ncbi:MAG TPA: hypothetical protein VEB42_12205, partial [Chitinophagaceae bacterium]|nr:hypothetical protein [Chitinophagaceae bacterium]
RWYCVKAGVSGGNPAPVWRSLSFNSGSNSSSGRYTPVVTNIANIDKAAVSACQYMRVGNIITVSGELQVDPRGAGSIEIALSLPVAAKLDAPGDAAGTAASSTGVMLRLSADAAGHRVRVTGVAPNGGNAAYSFTFTYRVM